MASSDMTVTIVGPAGEGVATAEKILRKVVLTAGGSICSTEEYMSRIRGGYNSTSLRISEDGLKAPLSRIDVAFPLTRGALEHISDRVSAQTVVIGEEKAFEGSVSQCKVPLDLTGIAKQCGVYRNMIITGLVCGILDIGKERVRDITYGHFAKKGDELAKKNADATVRGYDEGRAIAQRYNLSFTLSKKKVGTQKQKFICTGVEAIGLGAIAGGCNFIGAYPMSPSTGILTFLAKHQDTFGIAVEQVEDEIAAHNMSLGAWYAGARALTNSSGGGFALMEEAISLGGMIESPSVIHIAMRPGPATGLPTRTEQGDFDLALYSGHGEFPRAIFAPGTHEQAFKLTAMAFDLADKHQVPVFVLTDQFFMDWCVEADLDLSGIETKNHIVPTEPGYKRFKITPSGISPRGVPGLGNGLVLVDSDEHDEEGHLTEHLDMRIAMVDKRLRKMQGLIQDIVPPEHFGAKEYDAVIVCWGTNYHVMKEAIASLQSEGKASKTAMLHYSQLYPLHPDTAKMLQKAKKVAVLENNATGQFAKFIKQETGIMTMQNVLKYNGMPFTVEEVKHVLTARNLIE